MTPSPAASRAVNTPRVPLPASACAGAVIASVTAPTLPEATSTGSSKTTSDGPETASTRVCGTASASDAASVPRSSSASRDSALACDAAPAASVDSRTLNVASDAPACARNRSAPGRARKALSSAALPDSVRVAPSPAVNAMPPTAPIRAGAPSHASAPADTLSVATIVPSPATAAAGSTRAPPVGRSKRCGSTSAGAAAGCSAATVVTMAMRPRLATASTTRTPSALSAAGSNQTRPWVPNKAFRACALPDRRVLSACGAEASIGAPLATVTAPSASSTVEPSRPAKTKRCIGASNSSTTSASPAACRVWADSASGTIAPGVATRMAGRLSVAPDNCAPDTVGAASVTVSLATLPAASVSRTASAIGACAGPV